MMGGGYVIDGGYPEFLGVMGAIIPNKDPFCARGGKFRVAPLALLVHGRAAAKGDQVAEFGLPLVPQLVWRLEVKRFWTTRGHCLLDHDKKEMYLYKYNACIRKRRRRL